MTTRSKDGEKSPATMLKKAEQLRDAARAMQDYRSQALATLANAERLRALRLAKEQSHGPDANPPAQEKPAKKIPTQKKRA